MAIDSDLNLVQEIATSGIPAVYGDAAYPSVLAAGHPERARLIAPERAGAQLLVEEALRVIDLADLGTYS